MESPSADARDTNYASVAKLRKEWLPRRDTYRGLRTRPHETAATLRR